MGLHGMNVSVLAGWYTFSNRGPLTTTYTPSPQCSGSDNIYLGYINPSYGNAVAEFAVQCTTKLTYYSECMPTTTEKSTTARPTFTGTTEEEYYEWEDSQISYTGFGSYYSPGLECPSGWETVGLIGRDAGPSITSSGALSPATTTTVTRYTTGSDIYYYKYEDEASVMKSFLEPQQTMAICCPSGMTADSSGYCYSILNDYTPTYGCQVGTGYNYDYGEITTTYTDPRYSTITTVTHQVATATRTTVETYTTDLDSDQDYYSGLLYAPAITLLYHESDLPGSTAAASAEESTNGTTAETESPSNAAGRLGASGPVWEGVWLVVGIWAVAATLGAVMVLPL
ncbi:hypothetical protein BJY04DRAFT_49580 [Aspergillus karnatakaensis]|uniref:uncharacterized protein n=1 Tax=Aspergillus karnatakaensis TaxID=1810916 RepID=UPI003CCE00CE